MKDCNYCGIAWALCLADKAKQALGARWASVGDARDRPLETLSSRALRALARFIAPALHSAFLFLPKQALTSVGLFMLALWAVYRIARGWLGLNARQPMRA
jgi:hypothetical protein